LPSFIFFEKASHGEHGEHGEHGGRIKERETKAPKSSFVVFVPLCELF
jgi:hypothetical protein